jgi:hypothetical protein
MLDTKTGPQEIMGSLWNGLFVHRTIAASGWTISHRSGQAIASRLVDRATAERVRNELLAMSDVAWFAEHPFPDAMVRQRVLIYVRSLPVRHSRKPLRDVTSTPELPSRIRAAWTTRTMGLNGDHDQPLLLPAPDPLSRVQQRERQQLETFLTRTIPPIPNGALVTYYRHEHLRGSPDEPDEATIYRTKYSRKEKAWRFYLTNGLSLLGKQIVGVTMLRSDRRARTSDPDVPSL